MIQDIYPKKLYNQFVPGMKPREDSPVFCFRKSNVLIREGSAFALPLARELDEKDREELRFLFSIDQTAYFLWPEDDLSPEGSYGWEDIHQIRHRKDTPMELAYAAYTAFHLADWYRDNRHCGSCGTKTVPAPDERAMDCPSCGRRIYPRIMPAVIVGVTNGDSLLITWYADRPFTACALVAGFTEIGETLEETVAREVMEETGLRVRNIRYYKSQPWGIADDILMGFYCDVDGSTEIHRDPRELKKAMWVPREEITGQPDNLSLTNEMMLVFKAGNEPR